jgi:hypothetical protein
LTKDVDAEPDEAFPIFIHCVFTKGKEAYEKEGRNGDEPPENVESSLNEVGCECIREEVDTKPVGVNVGPRRPWANGNGEHGKPQGIRGHGN